MYSKFINFSNHPFRKWDKNQKEAALNYGEVIDIAFPSVNPYSSEEEIDSQADEYVKKIVEYAPAAVMCQGEFTLCFSIVRKLKHSGIKVLSACSKRDVVERNGKKISVFRFVRFREY